MTFETSCNWVGHRYNSKFAFSRSKPFILKCQLVWSFFRKFGFFANLDQDEKHEIVRFAGSRAAGNFGFEARAAFFANSNQNQSNWWCKNASRQFLIEAIEVNWSKRGRTWPFYWSDVPCLVTRHIIVLNKQGPCQMILIILSNI